VVLNTPHGEKTIPNQQVFALTGYQPDFSFIESMGVTLDPNNARCPIYNTETFESNVPGLYVAGVVVAGERTNEVFIENGRFHGAVIAKDLADKLGKGSVATPIKPEHTYAAE
jgi:thioredoxin reductase (NADPH)